MKNVTKITVCVAVTVIVAGAACIADDIVFLIAAPLIICTFLAGVFYVRDTPAKQRPPYERRLKCMMDEKLKPCPFCGAHAQIFENDDNTCYIECMCCFVRTDDYYNKKDLIADWNRRYDSSNGLTADPDEWDNALRMLLQAVSKITKLIKNENNS